MIEKHCPICHLEIIEEGGCATHYDGKKFCECGKPINKGDDMVIKKKSVRMEDFYKVMQESGNVKKALRDDKGFATWYSTKRKKK
jgi:hypothetical protein